MPGTVFDRAVGFYDATRGLPNGVPEQVRTAIRAHLGLTAQSRLLEIGIGTGRIALPFLQAGDRYFGADLSLPMMHVLRDKLGRTPPVVKADAEVLPFASASVDVVLMVHLLHLVHDWRAVLAECRRVLRPGGALLVAGNAANARREGERPGLRGTVGAQYEAALAAVGEQRSARRGSSWIQDAELIGALADHGITASRVEFVRYTSTPTTVRAIVENYRSRIYSGEWNRPEHIHAAAMERLDAWLAAYPTPDEPIAEEGVFGALLGRVATHT